MMDYQGRAESGLHLLARLSSRPSLLGLDEFLFPDGPNAKEIIEISGDASAGKTLLITQLLAQCLLPQSSQEFEIGGLGTGAIIIDTDHHFQVFKLANLMENRLQIFKIKRPDQKRLNTKAIEDIVKESLSNLTILKCHDSTQMLITFYSLPKILAKNPKVSLILLDSISAYYWQDVMTGGVRKMDMYAKRIVTALQKSVQEYKVVLAFTRPTYFQSKLKDSRDEFETTRTHKIHLQRTEVPGQSALFNISITLEDSQRSELYTIETDGLKWPKHQTTNIVSSVDH